MNPYSFFKAQSKKKILCDVFCDLFKTELMTSSIGLLKYFVNISISYLKLCFTWLYTCLFLHKSMQGPYPVYTSIRHITRAQMFINLNWSMEGMGIEGNRKEPKIMDALE